MSKPTIIEIPATPPTLNDWLSKHWRVRKRDKDEWVREINLRLHSVGFTPCEAIEASVTFRFPDRRRRDTGNYSSTLEKCLGDALRPDFITDDDHTRFHFVGAEIVAERGERLTRISLWPVLRRVAA